MKRVALSLLLLAGVGACYTTEEGGVAVGIEEMTDAQFEVFLSDLEALGSLGTALFLDDSAEDAEAAFKLVTRLTEATELLGASGPSAEWYARGIIRDIEDPVMRAVWLLAMNRVEQHGGISRILGEDGTVVGISERSMLALEAVIRGAKGVLPDG